MPANYVVLNEAKSSVWSCVSIAQSRSLPAGYVFRARLILMLAEGASFNTIKRQLRTTAPTISRWKTRFLDSGLDGLDTHHPGQLASVLTPALRARVLSARRKKPAHHLEALDRCGGRLHCLKAASRPDDSFEGAVISLDDVIQVLASAMLCRA